MRVPRRLKTTRSAEFGYAKIKRALPPMPPHYSPNGGGCRLHLPMFSASIESVQRELKMRQNRCSYLSNRGILQYS